METSVALAVLSLIVTIAAGAFRSPSEHMQTEAAFGALARAAQQTRLAAITEGQPMTLETRWLCDGARPVRFFADGSATGGPLCAGSARVALRPLSGAIDRLP